MINAIFTGWDTHVNETQMLRRAAGQLSRPCRRQLVPPSRLAAGGPLLGSIGATRYAPGVWCDRELESVGGNRLGETEPLNPPPGPHSRTPPRRPNGQHADHRPIQLNTVPCGPSHQPPSSESASADQYVVPVYSIGIAKAAAETLGEIGFVDAANKGAMLEVGRPFSMVEGTAGQVTIESPVSGEVVAVNARLVNAPGMLNDGATIDPDHWIVRSVCGLADACRRLQTLADACRRYKRVRIGTNGGCWPRWSQAAGQKPTPARIPGGLHGCRYHHDRSCPLYPQLPSQPPPRRRRHSHRHRQPL